MSVTPSAFPLPLPLQALVRRKVRVGSVREEIYYLRVPAPPIPVSWGRTVQPYVPLHKRSERPMAGAEWGPQHRRAQRLAAFQALRSPAAPPCCCSAAVPEISCPPSCVVLSEKSVHFLAAPVLSAGASRIVESNGGWRPGHGHSSHPADCVPRRAEHTRGRLGRSAGSGTGGTWWIPGCTHQHRLGVRWPGGRCGAGARAAAAAGCLCCWNLPPLLHVLLARTSLAWQAGYALLWLQWTEGVHTARRHYPATLPAALAYQSAYQPHRPPHLLPCSG
jgi:hypothetical protein